MGFCNNFVWGAGSASYQVEGAHDADGRGLSIWDVFSHLPDKVVHQDNGDVACDHYNRIPEDVALMKQAGIRAYRFSIAWARVLPSGYGEVNEKGLSFYERLVDALCDAGIEPYVTLYHWDLPQALQVQGGWQNPCISDWFADFAGIVSARLGARVKNYMTLNEPQIFIGMGHFTGEHSPGQQQPLADCYSMAHNAIIAHHKAVKAIRKACSHKVSIGLASTGRICTPATDTAANIAAARTRMFELEHENPWFSHNLFLDCAVFGRYPDELLQSPHAKLLPPNAQAELAGVFEPMDCIGYNVYNSMSVEQSGKFSQKHTGFPRTSLKWPITPESLYWGPKFLCERYPLPCIITENGMAQNDFVSLDGKVHDCNRIDFVHRYLLELQSACSEGVPIMGYFHWSFMDNFEWHSGYDERFGLVFVDYNSQKRILKDSAHWYASVIKANGENL